MGFEWLCPCGKKNSYKGGLTTEAITTCSACSLKLRIWKHRIVVKTTNKPPKTTKKPQIFNREGSILSLVIMANYAINTIKNKQSVKDQKGTYYDYYIDWSEWREIFREWITTK